jgi:hypothetical protein
MKSAPQRSVSITMHAWLSLNKPASEIYLLNRWEGPWKEGHGKLQGNVHFR